MYIFSYKQSIPNYKNILIRNSVAFIFSFVHLLLFVNIVKCISLSYGRVFLLICFCLYILNHLLFFSCCVATFLKKWFDVQKCKLRTTKTHMHEKSTLTSVGLRWYSLLLLCFRVKSNRANAMAPAPNGVVMVMVMRGMKTQCQREKGEG